MSEINKTLKPCLHIYSIYDANRKIIKYEIYSENCTKPIDEWKYVGDITVEEEKITMNDYRAISDTACDTAASEMPTIGAFIHETLDMQAETFATMNIIAEMMWGDEVAEPPFTPKENVMAGLAAIQENQRAIMTAVKAIANKL